MSRKIFVVLAVLGLLLVAFGGWAMGQEGEADMDHPIVTTGTDAVAVGTWVAARAYGFPAGEDPATHPAQAIILPYGIHPGMDIFSMEAFQQPESLIPDFTFEWELVAPDGSAAELMGDNVAYFEADVEGSYDLMLTVTDAAGNTAETVWTVYATTYVGSGYLEGPEDAEDQCVDCHEDVVVDWLVTGHASIFTDALEFGFLSEGNISHFATGYWHNSDSNGFDDVAAEAGWEIPEPGPDAWENMVAEFPEVAAMAQVQCEACHGPGYMHVFEASRAESMIGLGVSAGTCTSCHADAPEPIVAQWEMSAHGQENSRAFTYPIGEDRASCVACHSGVGFIDAAAGLPQEELRVDYQPITCAVCHDPHDAENPNQLRVFDVVVLPSGDELVDMGPAATCMSCHNARRDAVSMVEGERFSTPHYSTGAELMVGTGGYTWGEELPSSPHGWVIEGACIGCHMAEHETEMMGEEAMMEDVYATGGHTFAMTSPEGEQFVEACAVCHTSAESFDFEAFRDYDGDGIIETNEEEIAGLRTMLEAAIVEAGVGILDHHPYFEIPEDAGADVKGAIWNLKFSESPGSGVHNLKYTVSLLQLSLDKLGVSLEGAYIVE